jgi:hypothetical protein
MCTKRFKRFSGVLSAGVIAATIAWCAPAYADSIFEQQQPEAAVLRLGAAPVHLSDLENAFWMCDYVATLRGIEATPAALCSSVYEDLRSVKFAEDYEALLAWWRLRKSDEHRRIGAILTSFER